MLFEFGPQSSLLLIGFVQGLIYSIILWRRGTREGRLADKILATLLIVCIFHISHYMLGFAGWFDTRDWHTTFMFYFPLHNLLWGGPLIYFYFRSLTNRDFRFQRQHLWHFIPGLINFGMYVTNFLVDLVFHHWILGKPLPYFDNTLGVFAGFSENYLLDLIGWASLISMILYMIWVLRDYYRYKRYINDQFSDHGQIEFKWLRNLLYTIIFALTVATVVEVIDTFITALSYTQYWASHFAIAIMIFFISIFGQGAVPQIARPLNFEPIRGKEESKGEPSTKVIQEVDRWKGKLKEFMDHERPWLNPDLTLSQLAQELDTNTSVLSKVINSGFGLNFNDFINSYRIEEVKAKMKQGAMEQLTLMAIALDCGFNSKSTFNRSFKKIVGKSPREFANEL